MDSVGYRGDPAARPRRAARYAVLAGRSTSPLSHRPQSGRLTTGRTALGCWTGQPRRPVGRRAACRLPRRALPLSGAGPAPANCLGPTSCWTTQGTPRTRAGGGPGHRAIGPRPLTDPVIRGPSVWSSLQCVHLRPMSLLVGRPQRGAHRRWPHSVKRSHENAQPTTFLSR